MNKKSELAASDLIVDIGCDTKEEAEKLVPTWHFMFHDSTLVELQNDNYPAVHLMTESVFMLL